MSINPPFIKDTYGEILYSEVVQTYERKPGGLTPSNFYVPLEWFEMFDDANNNGQWDAAEEFEDLGDLARAAEAHRVTWHWVEGHTGHPENERCDAMANEAMDAFAAAGPEDASDPR